MLIHAFATPRTTPEVLASTQGDIAAFLRRLSCEEVQAIASGQLLGPFTAAASALFPGPALLYLGFAARSHISAGTPSTKAPKVLPPEEAELGLRWSHRPRVEQPCLLANR
jgi:hypothetical protein